MIKNKALILIFILLLIGHLRITSDGHYIIAGSGDLRVDIQSSQIFVNSEGDQISPNLPYSIYHILLALPIMTSSSPFLFSIQLTFLFILEITQILISKGQNFSKLLLHYVIAFGLLISPLLILNLVTNHNITNPSIFWNLNNFGLQSKFFNPLFQLNENGQEKAYLFLLILPYVIEPHMILATYILTSLMEIQYGIVVLPLALSVVNSLNKNKAKIYIILFFLTIYSVFTQPSQQIFISIIYKYININPYNYIYYLLFISIVIFIISFIIDVIIKKIDTKILMLVFIIIFILFLTYTKNVWDIIIGTIPIIILSIFHLHKKQLALTDKIKVNYILILISVMIIFYNIQKNDLILSRIYPLLGILSMTLLKYLNIKNKYLIEYSIIAFFITFLFYAILWIIAESGNGPLYSYSLKDIIFANKLCNSHPLSFYSFNITKYNYKKFFGVPIYDTCSIYVFNNTRILTLKWNDIFSIGYVGNQPFNSLNIIRSHGFICVNSSHVWFTSYTFYVSLMSGEIYTCTTIPSSYDVIMILYDNRIVSRQQTPVIFIYRNSTS